MHALSRMFRLDQIPRAANGRSLLLARAAAEPELNEHRALQSMRAIVIVILLSSVFMVGCASRMRNDKYISTYESRFYWGRASFILNNEPTAGTSPEQQCDQANDTSRRRSSRQVAAALIFGACVKPGFTTDQMRQIISDGRWLDVCRIEPQPMMFGGAPNSLTKGRTFGCRFSPTHRDRASGISSLRYPTVLLAGGPALEIAQYHFASPMRRSLF